LEQDEIYKKFGEGSILPPKKLYMVEKESRKKISSKQSEWIGNQRRKLIPLKEELTRLLGNLGYEVAKERVQKTPLTPLRLEQIRDGFRYYDFSKWKQIREHNLHEMVDEIKAYAEGELVKRAMSPDAKNVVHHSNSEHYRNQLDTIQEGPVDLLKLQTASDSEKKSEQSSDEEVPLDMIDRLHKSTGAIKSPRKIIQRSFSYGYRELLAEEFPTTCDVADDMFKPRVTFKRRHRKIIKRAKSYSYATLFEEESSYATLFEEESSSKHELELPRNTRKVIKRLNSAGWASTMSENDTNPFPPISESEPLPLQEYAFVC